MVKFWLYIGLGIERFTKSSTFKFELRSNDPIPGLLRLPTPEHAFSEFPPTLVIPHRVNLPFDLYFPISFPSSSISVNSCVTVRFLSVVNSVKPPANDNASPTVIPFELIG